MGMKRCVACKSAFDARGNARRCQPCRTGEPSVRTVTAAVRSQLDVLGKADSTLGAAALVLAGRLDAEGTADTAVAAMTKELRATMSELTSGAAAVGDPVDELKKRRDARRCKSA